VQRFVPDPLAYRKDIWHFGLFSFSCESQAINAADLKMFCNLRLLPLIVRFYFTPTARLPTRMKQIAQHNTCAHFQTFNCIEITFLCRSFYAFSRLDTPVKSDR
jgi:hypothetical protein